MDNNTPSLYRLKKGVPQRIILSEDDLPEKKIKAQFTMTGWKALARHIGVETGNAKLNSIPKIVQEINNYLLTNGKDRD